MSDYENFLVLEKNSGKQNSDFSSFGAKRLYLDYTRGGKIEFSKKLFVKILFVCV